MAPISDIPLTDSDRDALSADLARLERGPTAADSDRPGLLASILIAFAVPGVVAISAALIASLFTADTLGPLFWTWGILAAIGVGLLAFTPRWLGAMLARMEIRFFMPEERPGGKRSESIRAALAAGTFRRAVFTTTAAMHPRIIEVGSIDDEGPTFMLELQRDQWLLVRGSAFDHLTTLHDDDIAYRLPETLTIDWIPDTGQLLRIDQQPPLHELPAADFIEATHAAIAGPEPSDFCRAVTQVHAHL